MGAVAKARPIRVVVGALRLLIFTSWTALFPAWHACAFAAEVQSEPLGADGDRAFISIVGELSYNDVAKFRQIAVTSDQAVVWLASSGGSTLAAIEIGKIIRIKGYDTLVSKEAPCISACGLLWLAGQSRYLGTGARVGFHATYTQSNGSVQESGVGNALVGNYLTQLNLGQSAIIFATSAPPEGINWLTSENAPRLGISASTVASSEPQIATTSSAVKIPADSIPFRTVGAWTVAIDKTINNGCFILASYGGTVFFRLGIDAREPLDAYLLIMGSKWRSIKPDQKYDIKFQFGDQTPWTGKANGLLLGELKGLILHFDDTKLFDEFSSEENVKIYYKERQIENLNLNSSRAAIDAMWQCQKAQKVPDDPFSN